MAVYNYEGSIDAIVAIIDPPARRAGLEPKSGSIIDDAMTRLKTSEMHERMQMKIGDVVSRSYTDKTGNSINVSIVEITADARRMKLLTINHTDRKAAAEIGRKFSKEK